VLEVAYVCAAPEKAAVMDRTWPACVRREQRAVRAVERRVLGRAHFVAPMARARGGEADPPGPVTVPERGPENLDAAGTAEDHVHLHVQVGVPVLTRSLEGQLDGPPADGLSHLLTLRHEVKPEARSGAGASWLGSAHAGR
jgi:hypothetical protein